jgi:hypothetical protein
MMEFIMEGERVVQIFLSQSSSPELGVYEVTLERDGEFSCNCPGYMAKHSCMHIRFVKRRVNSDGVYQMEVSTRCTTEEAEKAQESPEAFRQFVIKYGKIETC